MKIFFPSFVANPTVSTAKCRPGILTSLFLPLKYILSRITICFCVALLPSYVLAGEQKKHETYNDWFISVYGGFDTFLSIEGIVQSGPDFGESGIAVIAVGKELGHYKDYLSFEVEGQIGQHFGLQTHSELNASGIVRWLPLPWDKYLDTSVAFGAGLSQASDIPKIEEEKLENTSRLLFYLSADIEAIIPKKPQWRIFTRLHHRSGAFGLLNNVTGGSNAAVLGIKYHF